MPTYIPTTAFIPTFLDDNGNLLSGGTIEAFISGTSTPTAMFTDESGTSAGDTITLNARGEPETSGATHQIWVDIDIVYDFTLKDSPGAIINSSQGISNSRSSSLFTFLPNVSGAVSTDIQTKLRQYITPQDYGLTNTLHVATTGSDSNLGGLGSPLLTLQAAIDRKSTRLNSSHGYISYAVFCLKKKSHWPSK